MLTVRNGKAAAPTYGSVSISLLKNMISFWRPKVEDAVSVADFLKVAEVLQSTTTTIPDLFGDFSALCVTDESSALDLLKSLSKQQLMLLTLLLAQCWVTESLQGDRERNDSRGSESDKPIIEWETGWCEYHQALTSTWDCYCNDTILVEVKAYRKEIRD